MDTQTTVVRPLLDPPPTEVGRPDPVDLQAAAESMADRLFGGALAMMELATIHLGLRLGLYRALQDLGAGDAGSARCHVDRDERCVREWLEQQAVAELLICLDEGAPPEHRRYELPVASAVVLLDAGAPAFLGPLSHFAVGTVLAVPQVEEAFRAGSGVAFSAYGTEVRHGPGWPIRSCSRSPTPRADQRRSRTLRPGDHRRYRRLWRSGAEPAPMAWR